MKEEIKNYQSQMKDRLKEFREAKKITQREVAEVLNVSVSVVGGWECGQYNIPDARVFQLCNIYGINEEWFRTGKGEMYKPEASPKDKLKLAAKTLFELLSEDVQNAVLEYMRELIDEQNRQKNNAAEGRNRN